MSDIFNPPTFGRILRNARIKSGLTLRATALKLKCDVGNLSKLENNRLAPPRTAKAIEKLFTDLGQPDFAETAVHFAYSFHLGSFHEEFYS